MKGLQNKNPFSLKPEAELGGIWKYMVDRFKPIDFLGVIYFETVSFLAWMQVFQNPGFFFNCPPLFWSFTFWNCIFPEFEGAFILKKKNPFMWLLSGAKPSIKGEKFLNKKNNLVFQEITGSYFIGFPVHWVPLASQCFKMGGVLKPPIYQRLGVRLVVPKTDSGQPFIEG
ncbi:MAG: hypothetical protein CM15mP88_3190 [Pseudomonadota bacterium]|nr:MAG: hypothetical protein CM15mP88_3190 [Pseudomonadota bacterium]